MARTLKSVGVVHLIAWSKSVKLDDIPAELARSRVLNTYDAASYCGLDVQMWRRLHKAGTIPLPVRISTRKLGWRLGDLADFVNRQAALAQGDAA